MVPVALAVLGLGLAAAPAAQGYQAEQALAGRAVFEQRCQGCHGGNLDDGRAPALAGPATNITRFETAQGLFDYLSVRMPANDRGSLTVNDAWAVTAYILSANGIEADGEVLSSITNAKEIPLTTGAPTDLTAPVEEQPMDEAADQEP